jgi:5-methylcytosine-specific restriction enzyme A
MDLDALMPTRLATHRPASNAPPRQSKPNRDGASNRFYASARWRKLRLSKLRQTPLCEVCTEQGRLVAATIVHHVTELRDDWAQGLDLANLQSLCAPCHSHLHAST